jgi:hypothetical protein
MFKDFTSGTKPSEPKIKDLKKTAHSAKKTFEVPETHLLPSFKGD